MHTRHVPRSSFRTLATTSTLALAVATLQAGCNDAGISGPDGSIDATPVDVGGTGGGIGSGGASGGATGSGGEQGTGGRVGAGGATGTGGSGTGGSGTGGSGTGGSGTGGAGSGGSDIPPDYPAPTAANRAICKTVPLTTSPAGAKVCPGGGDGPVCIECLLGGSTFNSTNVASADGIAAAGNYAVTVTLGGAAAGKTQINAEANRLLLAPVATTAGQSVTYAFVVNVRAKEGQPVQNVSAGYSGLDLYFSGPSAAAPQVSAIGYALVNAKTKPVMVYVAGDSTVCDQSDTDYAGWGQQLPQFFAPPVGIANYADSGESSGSFLNSAAMWGAVKNAMVAGDWVLIQFGHNDGNTSSAQFQANITKMVTDAKAKGVTPVLISPPARAIFNGGVLADQGSLHAADMQAVATAQKVAYIDLTSITSAWYKQLGSNGWQPYHALGTDRTHTNIAGADKIAGFVATAIKSQGIGLAKYER